MNFIKISILFICLSFTFILNSQSFKYPTNDKGQKIACEKFEQLEHYLNRINQIDSHKVKKERISTTTRSTGEVLVNEEENEMELHAAVNPVDEDNIIVGCIKLNPQDLAQSISIGIYTTNDGAETWTRSNFTGLFGSINTFIIGGGDPIIVFDSDGVAHLSWLIISIAEDANAWGIYYATSSDGGLNWESKDPIIDNLFTDIGGLSDLEFASDKQWMAVDNESTSDHFGNVYVVYVNISNITSATPNYEITFQKKLPTEEAFDTNRVVINTMDFGVAQFSSIDTDRQGNIYVTFFAHDNSDPNSYALYMAKSTDGGVSFLPEQKITDFTFAEVTNAEGEITGIGGNRLYPCPHIGIDKSGGEFDGRLYVSYTATTTPNSPEVGYDIYLTTSDDQGDTWSDTKIVNNDDDPISEQFYSAIDITDEGFVSLAWYDGRDAIGNSADIDYYLGVSKDGGASFEQIRVSSESSDFNEIGSLNGGFGIGEYNQVVSTDDYIIPFWADGRGNNGEISIYGFKQDKNTISSTEGELIKVNSDIFISSISPIPTSENLTVELKLSKANDVSYQLLDVTGKSILAKNVQRMSTGKNTLILDVSNLSTGQYILMISTDKDSISRKVSVLK